MAVEFHLAEDALALHLLLQHLEGLVDIVVTDENLHSAFLYNRAMDGTDSHGARATGARICTIRKPMAPRIEPRLRTSVDIEIVPADGHTLAANWKKRGLRWVAVFWAALQTKSVLACIPQMGVPEIKSNRSHPLLCRDAVWRIWSITTVLDRLRRSES